MTTSTPPAWHWLHECYVPVKTVSVTEGQAVKESVTTDPGYYPADVDEMCREYGQMREEALSTDSRNLSDSATLGVLNDSESPIDSRQTPDSATLRERNGDDPTGEDMWPLNRDQCPDCRCAPNMPHSPGCAGVQSVRETPTNLPVGAPNEHPAWVCSDCGEAIYGKPSGVSTWHMDTCDLCGETKAVTEPRDFGDSRTAAVSQLGHTATSCPECGSVTDIDYGETDESAPALADNPLLNHMGCTFNSCLDTAVAKNEGYAGSADPMANFNDSVKLGVPVPLAVAIRLSDKWARLCRLLQTGENPLADESITDTIMDAINYLAILLYALEPER